MKGKGLLKSILYFTLILSILASVLNLSACDRKYDEAEVKAASAELLRKSTTLNDVLYGSGIATVSGSNTNGAYYEADFLHLHSLGFSTIEELKKMVRDTFTADRDSLVHSAISPRESP